jgi:cytochrome P450
MADGTKPPDQELATSPIPYRAAAVPDHLAVFAEFAAGGRVYRYDGGVVLTNREDILRLNRSDDVFGLGGRGPTQGAERPLIPLDLDGPRHTYYRKILDPIFAPREMAKLVPVIEKRADHLIDQFVADGRAEFFEAFCVPLPSHVFLDLLGLPQSDFPLLREFKDIAIRGVGFEGDVEEGKARQRSYGKEIYEYIDDAMEQRRQRGLGSDLISRLMSAELRDGRKLSSEEIKDIMFLLIIAGLDTVTATLSDFIEWLARHRDARLSLMADPALLRGAVEELMRTQSPVVANTRFAAKDIEVAPGELVAAGSAIHVVNPTSNIDAATFPDPLTVDFSRPNASKHQSFGSGTHRCLGSHLARTELRAALTALHRRMSDYWIAEDDAAQFEQNFIRTVSYLPIGFTPA